MKLAALLAFATLCNAQLVETIAGGGSLEGMDAVSASTGFLSPIVFGDDGSLYFSSGTRILRIGTDKKLHVVACSGIYGYSGDAGPATEANCYRPEGLYRRFNGELLFSDGTRVRKVSREGVISTVAGNGPTANFASILPNYSPSLTEDAQGNIYLADPSRYRILRIPRGGVASPFVTFDPEDFSPSTIGLDANGSLVAGGSNGLRGIGFDGSVTVLLDRRTQSFRFGSLGGWASEPSGSTLVLLSNPGAVLYRLQPDGTLNALPTPTLTGATGVSRSPSGDIYWVIGSIVRRLLPDGSGEMVVGAATYSAPDGSIARGAVLNPGPVAVSSSGQVYFAEAPSGCRIRTITPAGTLQTIAGDGSCSNVSGGVFSTYQLAAAANGTVYATSLGGVLKIAPDGKVTRSDLPIYGNGLAVDSNGTAYSAGRDTVYAISPDGSFRRVAAASPAIGITIRTIAVDSLDNLHVFTNIAEGVVTPDGSATWNPISGSTVSSAAVGYGNTSWCVGIDGISRGCLAGKFGLSGGGFSGDGVPAASANFDTATSIASDKSGNLYVVSSRRIRRIAAPTGPTPAITPGGVVSSASGKAGVLTGGQLISIYGTNLASATTITALNDNRIPTYSGKTRVFVDGYLAPVLVATPSQVNAVVPFRGGSQVHVEVDGVLSAPASIQSTVGNPGLFTADASGSGPGAIVNQDGSINSRSNPALRGSIVTAYGTGAAFLENQLDGHLNTLPPFGILASTTTATVGGQAARMLYAGGAPYLVAGAIQLNLEIPTGITSGEAEVIVTFGSAQANRVTVFVR